MGGPGTASRSRANVGNFSQRDYTTDFFEGLYANPDAVAKKPADTNTGLDTDTNTGTHTNTGSDIDTGSDTDTEEGY